MRYSLFFFGSLFAVALLVVCNSVDFTNPLDERGDNYLDDRTPPAIGPGCGRPGELTCEEYWRKYWFDPNVNVAFRCDMRAPDIRVLQAGPATIGENEASAYRLLLGLDGSWSSILEWSEGATIIPAQLTGPGGTVLPSWPMPVYQPTGNNNYVVRYTAVKPVCADGSQPDSGFAQRGLTITEFRAPVTALPIVRLNPPTTVTVDVGTVYAEPGVSAVTEADGTPLALFRIEVQRVGASPQVINPPTGGGTIASINAQMLDQVTGFIRTVAPVDYVVTYIVRSQVNDSMARATRNVQVIPAGTSTLPVPTIVLNNYTMMVDGRPLALPDTAMLIRGTYVERGVARVFFTRTNDQGITETIEIPTAAVPIPAAPNTNVPTPRTITVTYALPAGNVGGVNYAATNITRSIRVHYMLDECVNENGIPNRPPAIVFNDHGGAESFTLPAGTAWANPMGGWTLTDPDGTPGSAWRYPIHFGGANPANLARGSYTITYLAIGECGQRTVRTRTLTVP
jgi:hypothetical protein